MDEQSVGFTYPPNWDDVVAEVQAGGLAMQKEVWARLDDDERQMFLGALAASKNRTTGMTQQDVSGEPAITPDRPDANFASLGGFGVSPDDVLGLQGVAKGAIGLAKKIPLPAAKTGAKLGGAAILAAKGHPYMGYQVAKNALRGHGRGVAKAATGVATKAPEVASQAAPAAGRIIKDVGKDVMDPSRADDIMEQVLGTSRPPGRGPDMSTGGKAVSMRSSNVATSAADNIPNPSNIQRVRSLEDLEAWLLAEGKNMRQATHEVAGAQKKGVKVSQRSPRSSK